MRSGNFSRQAKPQTVSVNAAVVRAVAAKETIKKTCAGFLRNDIGTIGKKYLGAACLGARDELDPSVSGGLFEGIAKQVIEQLPDELFVCLQVNIGCQIARDACMVRLKHGSIG